MTHGHGRIRFDARLLRPADPGPGDAWAFVVLPADASARLPRRGRTSVDGTIDGVPFQVRLEPDGRNSHWLKVDHAWLAASGVDVGRSARFEIAAVEREPEPAVPDDLAAALAAAPKALATWQATTTVARVDWIHWLTSGKQTATRAKRIRDACDMLASGRKRVCCFDPSGVYSKAFAAPDAAD